MVAANADNTLLNNLYYQKQLRSNNLVTSAAIFGSNASGKTNLFNALAFIKQLILTSDRTEIGGKIGAEPYLLDNSSKKLPSEFKLAFIYQTIRYQYSMKLETDRIIEEELFAYPKGVERLWFARSINPDWKPDFELDNVKWKFGSYLKGENKRLAELTRNNVLFLTQAAKLNHKQLSEVYEWFLNILQILDVTEGSSNFKRFRTNVIVQENKAMRAKLVSLLRQADLGIDDFEVREVEGSEEKPSEQVPLEIPDLFLISSKELQNQAKSLVPKSYKYYLRHSTDDPTNNVWFPMEYESFGTLKLFERGGPILYALEKGQVLVVDELDSSLHPILLRNLVNLFHSPETNPKGAQLIFNTHDTTLLDTNTFALPLLRRDQIWLVEKNKRGESEIYSLWDFKQTPRKDEALQKGYLGGRYGAIPIIDRLLEEDSTYQEKVVG